MKKFYKFYTLITIFILSTFSATVFADKNTFNITDLIDSIPFDDLLENDEFTNDDILDLINKKQKSNPYNWKLKENNQNTIIFYNENEKWVLRTYSMQKNNILLLVNTQLGNHQQAQNFSFFIYNKNINKLSKRINAKRFIANVKENDFLTKDNQFLNSKQKEVILHMNNDGTINAAPWTWMEPRWKSKKPEYQIQFTWNKSKGIFIKTKEKI